MNTPYLQHWGSAGRFTIVRMTPGYVAVLLIFINRMPFPAPTLDTAGEQNQTKT